MAQNVTDDNFEQEVIQADKMVLIDFWAEWCGPCRMLTPIVEELAKEYADRVKIVKMNIDENPKLPSNLGIRSIPTLMLFKDGKQIDSKLGVLPKPTLVSWLEENL